jgi:hypothetical protein
MSEFREEILTTAKVLLEGAQTALIRQTVRELYEQIFGEGSYKRIEIPEYVENGSYPDVNPYETLPNDVVYRFRYALNRLRRWAESESLDAEEIIAAVKAKLTAQPGL